MDAAEKPIKDAPDTLNPLTRRGLWDRLVYYFSWGLIKVLYLIFWHIRVTGRANLPRKGGVLVVANHLSIADPPTLSMISPRVLWFMGKVDLFRMKGIGPLLRSLRCFPVNPGRADRQALRTTEELLKDGRVVVIFPEGFVSPDGQMHEFQTGAALIALRNMVPVVPVAVSGTQQVVPYGAHAPVYKRARLSVVFGKPVPLDDLRERGVGRDVINEANARLLSAVQDLLQQIPSSM